MNNENIVEIKNLKKSFDKGKIIALNGTLCKIAIEQGIKTPVNQMIFSVLQL